MVLGLGPHQNPEPPSQLSRASRQVRLDRVSRVWSKLVLGLGPDQNLEPLLSFHNLSFENVFGRLDSWQWRCQSLEDAGLRFKCWECSNLRVNFPNHVPKLVNTGRGGRRREEREEGGGRGEGGREEEGGRGEGGRGEGGRGEGGRGEGGREEEREEEGGRGEKGRRRGREEERKGGGGTRAMGAQTKPLFERGRQSTAHGRAPSCSLGESKNCNTASCRRFACFAGQCWKSSSLPRYCRNLANIPGHVPKFVNTRAMGAQTKPLFAFRRG
jgi:hypothetical protein